MKGKATGGKAEGEDRAEGSKHEDHINRTMFVSLQQVMDSSNTSITPSLALPTTHYQPQGSSHSPTSPRHLLYHQGNSYPCPLMHDSVDHWQSSVVLLVFQHDQPSNALSQAPFGAGGGHLRVHLLCSPFLLVSCLPSTPVPPRWPFIGISREMALDSQHSIS